MVVPLAMIMSLCSGSIQTLHPATCLREQMLQPDVAKLTCQDVSLIVTYSTSRQGRFGPKLRGISQSPDFVSDTMPVLTVKSHMVAPDHPNVASRCAMLPDHGRLASLLVDHPLASTSEPLPQAETDWLADGPARGVTSAVAAGPLSGAVSSP
jgi:hypothetical protein